MSQLNLLKMKESDIDWFMGVARGEHFNAGQKYKYHERVERIFRDEVLKSLGNRGVIWMNGVRVGGLGVYETVEGLEISYFISQEYEGLGIMTAVLREYLNGLRDRRVYCYVLKKNVKSIKLLERLGFEVVDHDNNTVKGVCMR